MLRELMLQDDRIQATRLGRLLIGFGSKVAGALVFTLIHFLAPFGLHYPGWPLVGFWLLLLISDALTYLVIRSGLSSRLRDPSLTQAQVAAGIVLITYAMYFADEWRITLTITYVAGFMFALFRLNTRQMMWLSAFTVGCYGAMIGLLYLTGRPAMFRLLGIQLLVLVAILPWFAGVGGYISHLRSRQYEVLRRLGELATHDELTGLYNRRHLMDVLQQQRALAERGGYRFVLGLMDLDHFKRVNDAHGHAVGDRLLTAFARLLRGQIRTNDHAARYGGEEFIVVLSDVDLERGYEFCLRLRSALGQLRTQAPDLPADTDLTVSTGLTEYVPGESVDQLLERADRALYMAKHDGRDRCVALRGRNGSKLTSLPATPR
ncbi:MAG: GGDEF domain-containing protein [Pseudomonadota bacterium]|nr:GGDEF domain-containing protein [Pseudomonadota bacterium]